MKILMVGSEAVPFVKTGGLADVLGALPAALARIGEDVAVVLPKYRATEAPGAERVWIRMGLSVGPHHFNVAIDQVVRQGVRYFFVDCPTLYDRPEIYGFYPDNHIRFALLCQAALGVARYIFRPHVFHTHDWQCGLLGPYLRMNFAGDPTFLGTRCAFTIHNLGYQGNFPAAAFRDLGLPAAAFQVQGLEYWGMVSLMKAGIVWADAITTVSPTHAAEIQTPELGFGMDGILRDRAGKLKGILNGVDYDEWNPQTDPNLAANYSAEDLTGKQTSKVKLLDEMGLENGAAGIKRPLIGIVSRFAEQKGFDLVEDIADWLGEQEISLAVVGSGEERFERVFRQLATDHPDKFALYVGYNNGLAHRIEAGADMFLMPSRYEPCGLNQIYSLRYGTVPIVRATGGLEDTVDETTGFKFREYKPEALAATIASAQEAYQEPRAWLARMRRGMAKDFSWDASAREYQRLFQNL